jgi:hypothetical protein
MPTRRYDDAPAVAHDAGDVVVFGYDRDHEERGRSSATPLDGTRPRTTSFPLARNHDETYIGASSAPSRVR